MRTGGDLPSAGRAAVEGVERMFVLGVIACAAVCASAMLLAWADSFKPIPLAVVAAIAATVCVHATVRSWHRAGLAVRRTPARALLALAALSLIAALLAARPARYDFDGSDGSVYVALASMLKTHGTLRPHDSVAALIDGEAERALFRPATVAHLPSRFPGGVELNPESDRWTPGFLHLYPVIMAAAATALGSDAVWFVNPLLAVLSVVALWLLSRRLAGDVAGVVAAGLLAMNVVQVWFARFPTAEMTAQALLLSGLYLALLACDTRWRVPAAGAGLLFGLLSFTRIEVLVLVAPCVALFLAVERARRGPSVIQWMGAVFGLVTAAGLAYLFTVGDAYVERITATVAPYSTGLVGWLMVAGAVAAPGVALLRRSRRSLDRPLGVFTSPRVKRAKTWMAVTLAVSAAGWVLWSHALRGTFVELISVPGLVAAMAGTGLLFVGRDANRAWLAGMLGLGSVAIVALCGPADTFVLPWSLRRSVPVLLPMSMLAIGLTVATVGRHVGRARFAVLCAPAALGASFIWHTWPVATAHVMRDGPVELAKIAAVTEPTDLVIWDVGLPSHLPLAVHSALGRTSIIALPGAASDAALRCVIENALASGRRVQLIVDDDRETMGRSPWPRRLEGLRIEFTASVRIESTALSREATHLRFHPRQRERRLDIYQLIPVDEEDGDEGGLSLSDWIDIGGPDLPYLLEGFHGAEMAEGVSYRWTAAVARIRVPELAHRATGTLTLRLKSSHPVHTPLPVDLDWNGVAIARLLVTGTLSEYVVTIDDSAARQSAGAHAVLTIRSPTFVPRDLGLGGDSRPLGVLVDGISVR